MTTPSEYSDLQTTVIDQLNVQITIGGTVLNPAFPSQSAADFCIDAADTIERIIATQQRLYYLHHI